ncbi:hypothetical protein BHE74_00022504 [Ensete ventricosum]|nr:hypothetical protein BHE74_00022504 [Ensete ventricosum]
MEGALGSNWMGRLRICWNSGQEEMPQLGSVVESYKKVRSGGVPDVTPPMVKLISLLPPPPDPRSVPIMDAPKFPTRPPAARFFSFPTKNPSSAHKPHSRSLWLSIASSVVFVVLVYLAAASRSPPPPLRFGIIIDAGSSGTRIHVFGSKGESGAIPSLVPGSTAVMRVTPGLSSFSGDPERAGASLEELLEFAKGKVAKDRWRDTEVRLMATAGLRMVDMGSRERILESCRRVLRLSGFRFKNEWATVIPGI